MRSAAPGRRPRSLRARLARTFASGALALASVAAGGCYTYRAAPLDGVRPGARVRVTLTPEGSAGLAPVLGTSVSGVEGRWEGAAGDSAVVRVERLLTTPGVNIAWNGAAVGIRRGAIQSVERTTIARQRTALVAGGGVALAVLLAELFRRGGKARGGPGDGGPTPF